MSFLGYISSTSIYLSFPSQSVWWRQSYNYNISYCQEENMLLTYDCGQLDVALQTRPDHTWTTVWQMTQSRTSTTSLAYILNLKMMWFTQGWALHVLSTVFIWCSANNAKSMFVKGLSTTTNVSTDVNQKINTRRLIYILIYIFMYFKYIYI